MPSLLFAPGSVRLRHQRPDNQKAYLAELQRQAERDKKKNKGNFVYYCAWEDRPDAIKIGFTTNVLDRMKSFLTGSPSNLLMLALSQVNGPHDEAALHSEFKNSRIRGEWFNLDKNFVQHIFSIDQSLAFSIHKQFPEHYKNCIIVPTIEDYINTVM
jgi:hypothetical protein